MDQSTLAAIAMALGGAIAGYLGGRKNTPLAVETVTLLTSQLEELRAQCAQIPALHERIAILEELVTQRAKVDEVLEIVTDIREKVNHG
jgi:hypothetical protein